MADSTVTLVKSVAKSIQISPRKVNEVVALVRGRTVDDALVILQHTSRRAATPVSKVITSAKANAKNNHNLKENTLVLDQIYVTTGQRHKRHRIHGRGVINQYQKRTCHIYVTVTGEQKATSKATVKKESK